MKPVTAKTPTAKVWEPVLTRNRGFVGHFDQ